MSSSRISKWLGGKQSSKKTSEDLPEPGSVCSLECLFHNFSCPSEEKETATVTADELSPADCGPQQNRRPPPGLYTPIGDWQTRLLELKPGAIGDELCADLHVVDLILKPGVAIHDRDQRIDFEAISYTWGVPRFTMPLKLNGRFTLFITPNLYAALVHLRRPSVERFIWADLVCINQYDKDEKAFQIPNMLDIYKKAASVISWLGEGDRDTLACIEHLLKESWGLKLHRYSDCSKLCCNAHQSFLKHKISGFLENPYFTRVWVRQEVWAAANLVVHYGPLEISWEDILLMARVADGGRYTMGELQICLHSFRSPDHKPGTDWSLLNVLQEGSNSRCWDLRDHVFGLVGMTSARSSFDIDYHKSVRAVYVDCSTYILSTMGPDYLLTLEGQYGGTIGGDPLPSWCPDWSQQFSSQSPYSDFRKQASAWPRLSFEVRGRTLVMSGIHIATIRCLPAQSKKGRIEVQVVDGVQWLKLSWSRIPPRTKGLVCNGREIQVGDLIIATTTGRKEDIMVDSETTVTEYRAIQYIVRQNSKGRYTLVGWTTWPTDTCCDFLDEKSVRQRFEIV